MKFIKKLSIAFAIIAVLAVAGIYAVTAYIDKSFVEKQISSALGREFKINGELVPQFNLSPTIKITNATLANADWGSKAPLAKIGEAELNLQIIPLLSDEIQINSLTLKNSEISLEKKKGKWNFDFADEQKLEEKKAKKEGEIPQKLSINEVNFENVKLTVKDGKTSVYAINKLALDSATKASSISLNAVMDGTKIKLDGGINALTEVVETNKLHIDDMKLAYGEYKLNANVKADLAKMKASIKNMKLAAMGYDIAGNIEADLSKKTPYIKGAIEIDEIDLSDKSGESKANSAELYSKKPLPLDALDLVNGDVGVKIGKLIVNEKITLLNLNVPAIISNGVLTAKNVTTNFDDSSVMLDTKLSKSNSSLLLNIKNLNSADLFLEKDFSGGLTDVSADLRASGDSVYKMVNSLSGTTNIHLKNAVYSGEVRDNLLQQLFKLLAGGAASNRTEISCVIGDIAWTNGVGDLRDFGIVSDYALVVGKGKIKLPTQKVKVTLYPEAKNIGLTDFLIPSIVISGSVDNYSVYPEAKGTAVTALKTAAGIATGVGIFAKLGEVLADKTGVTQALGLKAANPCLKNEKAVEETATEIEEKVAEAVANESTEIPAVTPVETPNFVAPIIAPAEPINEVTAPAETSAPEAVKSIEEPKKSDAEQTPAAEAEVEPEVEVNAEAEVEVEAEVEAEPEATSPSTAN